MVNLAVGRDTGNSVQTGTDGAVAKSSAKGLVGTGFASRYRVIPRACGFF